MKSLILRTSSLYLHPLLLLFSAYLLLHGHNEPGGGFAGGMIAASAFCLHMIAFNVQSARNLLYAEPRVMVALGLLATLLSGCPALFRGEPFLTGTWLHIDLLGLTSFPLGSPLLFDVGVFHVVLGVALMLVFSFAEEEGV